MSLLPAKLFAALTFVALISACGGSQTPHGDDSPPASVDASAPTATPTEAIVRRSGGEVQPPYRGKTHRLEVTIRDEGVLDAYVEEGKRCVAPLPQFPPTLVIVELGEDPAGDTSSDWRAPSSGQLLADGTCEVHMAIDAPYSSKYSLGLAVEGNGIADPANDPRPAVVMTSGTAQEVVVTF